MWMHTSAQEKKDALLELQQLRNQFVKDTPASVFKDKPRKQIFSFLLSSFQPRRKWHACRSAWAFVSLFWWCNSKATSEAVFNFDPNCNQQVYFLYKTFSVIFQLYLHANFNLRFTYHTPAAARGLILASLFQKEGLHSSRTVRFDRGWSFLAQLLKTTKFETKSCRLSEATKSISLSVRCVLELLLMILVVSFHSTNSRTNLFWEKMGLTFFQSCFAACLIKQIDSKLTNREV